MLAYTYIKQGKFELIEKPKPELRTRVMLLCASLSEVFVPVTCILNMVVCHVLFPE